MSQQRINPDLLTQSLELFFTPSCVAISKTWVPGLLSNFIPQSSEGLLAIIKDQINSHSENEDLLLSKIH